MRATIWFCIPALLLAFQGSSRGLPPDKEKVEEGHYALLRKGGLVSGSEHSWTLWRLPDGRFELEDHFQADNTALTLFRGMLAPGMPLSSEFRKSLEDAIEPTDMSAILDPDNKVTSLTVSGVKLNGGRGIGLKCMVTSNRLKCAGTSGKAKLGVDESRGLFWWYGIPMLLRSWSASPPVGASGKEPKKIAILSFGVAPKVGDEVRIGMKAEPGAREFWGDKPELGRADLTIADLGPDTLVVGDKTFHAQTYRLQVKFDIGDPLALTVWTDARGVILAVKDASKPDDLVALVQYKKYADSPPVTPTTTDK